MKPNQMVRASGQTATSASTAIIGDRKIAAVRAEPRLAVEALALTSVRRATGGRDRDRGG